MAAGLLAGAGVLANPAARLAALRGAAALWRFARPSVTRSAAARIAAMGAARLRDARGSAARKPGVDHHHQDESGHQGARGDVPGGPWRGFPG